MVDLTATLFLDAALAINACNDARQKITVYFFATTPITGCAFTLHCFNFSCSCFQNFTQN